jgi:hypothetical protein
MTSSVSAGAASNGARFLFGIQSGEDRDPRDSQRVDLVVFDVPDAARRHVGACGELLLGQAGTDRELTRITPDSTLVHVPRWASADARLCRIR